MNVLILNQHFYPEIAATAQLVTDLAVDLARNDISITVIAGKQSYAKDGKERQPYYENWNGIDVYRVFTTSFDKNRKPLRMANYVIFYVFSLIKALSLPRHDIVISMSTPPFLAITGLILTKVKKCKFIYWVQDLYPDLAITFGYMKERGILARILKNIMRLVYKEADVVVSIGEKMAARLKMQGVEKGKIRVIHNWADPEDFRFESPGENSIRKYLGLDGKFVILYSGNMGVVHDLETIKEGVIKLQNNGNLAFVFIGDGVKKPELDEFKRKNNMKNVYFLPYQPRAMLKNSMQAGDVILVTQEEKSSGLMVPSKIYSALVVGKPVMAIGPRDSELFDIVSCYHKGMFFENGDVEGFVSAIESLSDRRSDKTCTDGDPREYVPKEYLRSNATNTFNNLIVNLINNNF